MARFHPFSYTSHQTLHIICIVTLWSLLFYCDLCKSICCCDGIVFLRNGAFFKEAVLLQQSYAKKYYTLPDLEGTVTQIKRTTEK